MSLRKTDNGWAWGIKEYTGDYALISALKTGIYQEGPEKVREIVSGMRNVEGVTQQALYTAVLIYEDETKKK